MGRALNLSQFQHNVTDGTTTVATTYVTNGSAKAWCCWNGTGTAAIRDSLNVSSLTDNGVGDYTFAYTDNFGSANYQIGGQFAYSSAITTYAYVVQPRENAAVTASSARLITVPVGASSSGADVDYPYAAFNAHGDLA
jgi:hypothetical protein